MQTNGGSDLEVIFAINVDDPIIQCHVSTVATGAADDKDDIRAEVITVTIVNDEEYNFIDVIVRANFTGTPWYMPVIGMRTPWVEATNANAATPFAAWDAAGNMAVTFPVDTDPSLTPDRYPFQLEITAVIEETLAVVTVVVDYTQGAVIDYTGYGPDIYITGFTADDIVPGQDFVLDLTIQNVGDDTLRDVTIWIGTDGTDEYGWGDVIDFQDQFDWSAVYENWMDVSGPITIPDDMFYTFEDLDVDNVREIVEINLYMDGVYSDPAARIEVIHILDLAPGATTNVVFDMITDKDMVNGKPYDFPVDIEGIDTDGGSYSEERWITVQSSLPGESYNPVELDWFDAGLKALALFLFFIIVLAILLFVYNMFKGDSYDEDEEDFDFEDDEPFEPTPETPAKKESEELVEP
jgi:cbb3-type cytochrome oxidase subunit 3